jgi:2-polyprenyl-3-methyl-5-hydroxy-6-metoxy-1,4-benzoquinol methylase
VSVCLLCGSDRATLLLRQTDRLYGTTDREFAVVRCQQCGLARLDPQPSREELHRYYPPNYWFAPDASLVARLEETYRRVVLRGHVKFAERALRSSSSRGPVLDVGCGGGLFLGMLRRRGFRVVGLDFSREAAQLAWKHQGVPVVVGDLERAPLRPASFACITMSHVLEHLPDPRAYLAAARALLAPDGRLVVHVPNIDCWQFRLLGRSWNGIDVPRHLFDYRGEDMARLLASTGFEVVRRADFSWRDNPAGLATSLAPSLDPMARRVRGVPEGAGLRLVKDLAHFGLAFVALPFTLLEAAFGAGSTVMMEARKR